MENAARVRLLCVFTVWRNALHKQVGRRAQDPDKRRKNQENLGNENHKKDGRKLGQKRSGKD
ncbi:hypothetical protein THIX_90603 [Thiomonas sp. X19]|nr:hypothetical protein THIX_90603 [Thiomonas sp. X19]